MEKRVKERNDRISSGSSEFFTTVIGSASNSNKDHRVLSRVGETEKGNKENVRRSQYKR